MKETHQKTAYFKSTEQILLLEVMYQMKNNLERFGLGFILGVMLFGIMSVMIVSYLR